MDRRALPAAVLAALALAPAAHAADAQSDDQSLQRTRHAVAAGLKPPLGVAWRHQHKAFHDVFAAAGGLVFAATGISKGTATGTIEALDAATGQLRWEVPTTYTNTYGAYADGLVIVNAAVPGRAAVVLDAQTGATRWQVPADDAWPAVDAGRVFVSYRHKINAYRLGDGAPLWSVSSPLPERGKALVAAGGLVYTGTYPQAAAYDAATGAERFPKGSRHKYWGRWHAAFDGGLIHTMNDTGSGAVMSGTTGQELARYPTAGPPAIGRGRVFAWEHVPSVLNAFAWRGGRLVKVWEFGRGGQWPTPLLADDLVYVKMNCVYALDARTGTTVWTSDSLAGERNADALVTGEGRLLSAHADGITALASQPGAPSGTCQAFPTVHTPDYDPNEQLTPGLTPGGAVTAQARKGGRALVTATGMYPGQRVRLTLRCGTRIAAGRTVTADENGTARATLRRPRCRNLRAVATSGPSVRLGPVRVSYLS